MQPDPDRLIPLHPPQRRYGRCAYCQSRAGDDGYCGAHRPFVNAQARLRAGILRIRRRLAAGALSAGDRAVLDENLAHLEARLAVLNGDTEAMRRHVPPPVQLPQRRKARTGTHE